MSKRIWAPTGKYAVRPGSMHFKPDTSTAITQAEAAFLNARTNPFGEEGTEYLNATAKIPDSSGATTTTYVLHARHDVAAGALGTQCVITTHRPLYQAPAGQIYAMCIASGGATPTTDMSVEYNNSMTYAGTVMGASNDVGLGTYRVVGQALRVYATSPPESTAGVITTGNNPHPLHNGTTYNALTTLDQCMERAQYLMSEGATVRLRPTSNNDDEFAPARKAGDETNLKSDNSNKCCLILRNIGTNTSFVIESICIVEVVMKVTDTGLPTQVSPYSNRFAMLNHMASSSDVFPIHHSGHSFSSAVKGAWDGTWRAIGNAASWLKEHPAVTAGAAATAAALTGGALAGPSAGLYAMAGTAGLGRYIISERAKQQQQGQRQEQAQIRAVEREERMRERYATRARIGIARAQNRANMRAIIQNPALMQRYRAAARIAAQARQPAQQMNILGAAPARFQRPPAPAVARFRRQQAARHNIRGA